MFVVVACLIVKRTEGTVIFAGGDHYDNLLYCLLIYIICLSPNLARDESVVINQALKVAVCKF